MKAQKLAENRKEYKNQLTEVILLFTWEAKDTAAVFFLIHKVIIKILLKPGPVADEINKAANKLVLAALLEL